mmetsp:Transcript_20924/g.29980  ORF Transcript_20924/g.29980 Transcript_20924/m.29980 type:complete len:417 (+) Transcript_20924:157-1407(+)
MMFGCIKCFVLRPCGFGSEVGHSNNAKWTLLLCAIVYGLNYVISKDLQDSKDYGIEPGRLNAIRFFLASSVFLADIYHSFINAIQNKDETINDNILSRNQQATALFTGLELGLWAACGFLSQSLSLRFSSASKVSFFSGLAVVVTPLISMVVKKLSSSASKTVKNTSAVDITAINVSPIWGIAWCKKHSGWLAPCLAVAGAAALEWGGMDGAGWGDLYLLLTPLAFGLWFHRSEIHSIAMQKEAEVRTINKQYQQQQLFLKDPTIVIKTVPSSLMVNKLTKVVTGTMLLTASLLSFLFSHFTEMKPLSESFNMQHFPKIAGLLLFSGLISTGWTALSEQKAMRFISAAEATLIYTMEPLFATAFAFYFLHEEVGINTAVGAALIITACLLGSGHGGHSDADTCSSSHIDGDSIDNR